jgi:DNA topoisomerase IA
MQATPLGLVVGDFLGTHFPEIFAVLFTATLESQLDQIATG